MVDVGVTLVTEIVVRFGGREIGVYLEYWL